jgi:hypothetical protein
MKLVFIYGPPAVGKLTVAKKLSKITKFKLFHNHLTVDLLNTVLKFGTDSYFKLNDKIRLSILEEAAKQNVKGVVFTFSHSYPEDTRWAKRVARRIKKFNGKVYFVHIVCEKEQLTIRVKHSSRKKFHKVKTTKKLQEVLKKWDFFTTIPLVDCLVIDNPNLAPEKVASKIKAYYRL